MDLYQHQPLDLERPTIRLVRILGSADPNIECEFIEAWLDEEVIDYEALSYTWGPPDLTKSIIVSGRRLPITSNLHTALLHLRSTKYDRIFWIDAISINQDDPKERGHQVQQMGDIYRRAEQVTVWLGASTTATDGLMESLSLLTKYTKGLNTGYWSSAEERWISISDTLQLCMALDPAQTRLGGLLDLLDRPWFSRVWILQEIALARYAVIACGKKSVPARIFAAAPYMYHCSVGLHHRAVLDLMSTASRRTGKSKPSRTLYSLLLKFKDSQASEPRDLIYALIGLSTDTNIVQLMPTYESSDREVIRTTCVYLFGLPLNHSRLAPDSAALPDFPFPDNILLFLDRLRGLRRDAIFYIARYLSVSHLRILLHQTKGNMPCEIEGDMTYETAIMAAARNDSHGKEILEYLKDSIYREAEGSKTKEKGLYSALLDAYESEEISWTMRDVLGSLCWQFGDRFDYHDQRLYADLA